MPRSGLDDLAVLRSHSSAGTPDTPGTCRGGSPMLRPGRSWSASSCCSRRRSAGCSRRTRPGLIAGRCLQRWPPPARLTPSGSGTGSVTRAEPFGCTRPRSSLSAGTAAGAGVGRRAACAAGRRHLHRGRRCQLRFRPAACSPGHQRAPGAGQAGHRREPAAAAPTAAELRLAESLLPQDGRAGSAVVSRRDGTWRAGLHRNAAAL